MRYLLVFILLTFSLFAKADDKLYTQKELNNIAERIKQKGLALYVFQKIYWNSYELVKSRRPDITDSMGGQITYLDNNIFKCILYSKEDSPSVIATVSYDTTYNINQGFMDLNIRSFNTQEAELYKLKKSAQSLFKTDTSFKKYSDVITIIIPLISGEEKEAYLFSYLTEKNEIEFGNDYQIQFDRNNTLTYQKLHSTPAFYYLDNKDSVTGHIHVHHPGEDPFMTPTDICMALRYERYRNMHNCTVISDRYISIWNGKMLYILRRDRLPN